MTTKIPLTGGFVALVDDEDAALILDMAKWQAVRDGHVTYAQKVITRDGRDVSIRMHQVITGWALTDHIDGDGLNNTRANLRPATLAQNQWNRRRASNNTTGYKGVSVDTARGRWKSAIRVAGGQRIFLGYFNDPLEAARAYDAAARLHHGEFARPNFPEAM